jgi:hypothetical protein
MVDPLERKCSERIMLHLDSNIELSSASLIHAERCKRPNSRDRVRCCLGVKEVWLTKNLGVRFHSGLSSPVSVLPLPAS